MTAGRVAVGHPVDVASGQFFTFATDLVVGGTVPLVVGRCYRAPLESENAAFRSAYEPAPELPFGPGWRLCGVPELRKTASGFVLTTMDGDPISLRETRDDELAETGRLVDPAASVELRRINATEVRAFRFGVNRYPLDMVFEDRGSRGFRARSFSRTAQARLDFSYDEQGRVVGFHQTREGRHARLVWEGARVRDLVLEVPPAIPTNDALTGTNQYGVTAKRVARTVLSFVYDHWGRLIETRDANGVVSQYRFDATGRMDREKSRTGSVYSMEYDGQGRCKKVSGDGRYQERSLTFGERETRVADSHGRVTRYVHNAAGQILEETSPTGERTLTAYDELGRPVAKVEPRGGKTAWTYDAQGRTATVSTPDGVVEMYTHDDAHRLVAREEIPGRRVELAYDAEGGVARVQARGQQSWRVSRNEYGEWTRLTNPEGNSRDVSRDRYGHVRAATDFRGASFHYDRDEMGRVSARIDPLGNITRYAYDRDGQLVWQQAADSTVWTRAIDPSGRRTEYHRPDGRKAVVTLSSCGQPITVQGFDGSTVEYEWDTEPGELRIVRNAAREEYRLAYDREGHVERREHFDGRVYRLAWKNGDLQTSLDPCERLTAYKYDLAGRIVSRKTPEGETTWKYVGKDVAAIANENGVLAYERDETGQVVVENQLGTEIRYERDGMGRRTKQTTPWGETKYAYDANGDWIGLEHGAAQIKVERDAMGREVRRHVGTASEGPLGTFDQAFDPVGRLTGQRYRPGGKEDVSWWRHVQYDAVGNPTRIADSARGTKDYLHNAAGQLVGVLHDGKAGEFYDWDSRGNIVYEADIDDASGVFAAVAQQMDRMGPVLAKVPRRSTERRFGKGSRISESKQADRTITYLHDAAGCVVEKTVRHADGRVEAYKFEWNTLGQMVRAVVQDSDVWDYRYDAVGRRIAKLTPAAATLLSVWDGARVIYQLQGSATDRLPVNVESSLYPPNQIQLAWHERRSTSPSAATVGSGWFVLNDQVGTSTIRMNRLAGPVPPPVVTWGASETCFSGQVSDKETGLSYNLYRFYDPDSRRYLSPDPLGLLGSTNDFAFVNSPVTESDPYGLAPTCAHYSVLFSFQLDEDEFGESRKVHFNRANAGLDEAIQSDPEFQASMESVVPGISQAVASEGGRQTPPGFIWHHALADQANGSFGVMQLVPDSEHSPGSPQWGALHSDPGRGGGYAQWAKPAGAP